MSNWLSHASVLGHVGKIGQKISDPLAWIGGDRWTHLTSDVLPGKVNEGLSHVMQPFEYVDKTINPVRKIPIVDRIGNIVAAKPGDAGALAVGAYFGGSALLGGGGSSGVGGGGGAGLVDSGSVAGAPDAAGLAELDSNAVVAEGAEPGLTSGYGSVESAPESMSSQYQGGQQQQKKQKPPLDQMAVITEPTIEERQRDLDVVTSSMRHKGPAAAPDVHEIARAGASGQDKISRNGVHLGALRGLDTNLLKLEALARRKGVRV